LREDKSESQQKEKMGVRELRDKKSEIGASSRVVK